VTKVLIADELSPKLSTSFAAAAWRSMCALVSKNPTS